MIYDYQKQVHSALAVFDVAGDFGTISDSIVQDGNTLSASCGGVEACAIFEEKNEGVFLRRDVVSNHSGSTVQLRAAKSVFVMDGASYEVYTQSNTWRRESEGSWQRLNTGIISECRTNRTSTGCTPMIALWNEQLSKGIVFHLLPFCAYELRAFYGNFHAQTRELIVEIGICDHCFSYPLLPGESLELPNVLYYEFHNKTDLDAYKLHRYCNQTLPAYAMPVVYNTWLYVFDHLTFEKIEQQITPAADLGAEYFVIDAGWFGKGSDWMTSRGDYIENTTGALFGQMKTLSQKVYEKGMKFGLWFELETADRNSDIVHAHPEYFKPNGDELLLDFSNREAAEYLFGLLCSAIETYDIRWLKLDFNQIFPFDTEQQAFLPWYRGYLHFIDRLKLRYHDLYLENCASGGQRMNLAFAGRFSGFWLSDNQSPYDGLRIVKESLLRLPPQMIERYACITSYDCSMPEPSQKILACCDNEWGKIENISFSYLTAFLYGGGLGISCDLTLLNQKDYTDLKEYIRFHKSERDFLRNAEAHILIDADGVTAIEYTDSDLKKCVISVIAEHLHQPNITVFPLLKENVSYRLDEDVFSGKELIENGISFQITEQNDRFAYIATLLQTEGCAANALPETFAEKHG